MHWAVVIDHPIKTNTIEIQRDEYNHFCTIMISLAIVQNLKTVDLKPTQINLLAGFSYHFFFHSIVQGEEIRKKKKLALNILTDFTGI